MLKAVKWKRSNRLDRVSLGDQTSHSIIYHLISATWSARPAAHVMYVIKSWSHWLLLRTQIQGSKWYEEGTSGIVSLWILTYWCSVPDYRRDPGPSRRSPFWLVAIFYCLYVTSEWWREHIPLLLPVYFIPLIITAPCVTSRSVCSFAIWRRSGGVRGPLSRPGNGLPSTRFHNVTPTDAVRKTLCVAFQSDLIKEVTGGTGVCRGIATDQVLRAF